MKKAPTTFQADGALGEQLSFVPPAAFCPSWPKRNTATALACQMYFDGHAHDHEDFIGACSPWRLATVVFHLRTLLWPIDAIDKVSPSRAHPGRVIALYKLPCKYVAEVPAPNTGEARDR